MCLVVVVVVVVVVMVVMVVMVVCVVVVVVTEGLSRRGRGGHGGRCVMVVLMYIVYARAQISVLALRSRHLCLTCRPYPHATHTTCRPYPHATQTHTVLPAPRACHCSQPLQTARHPSVFVFITQ